MGWTLHTTRSDCLIERIRVAPSVFHRRRSCNGNGNGNGNPKFRKPVKKRFNNPTEPSISKRSSSCEDFRTKQNNHHLVTGQVTILRRGQSFDTKTKGKSIDDLILCGTQRSGPGPELVPKQNRIGEGDLKSPVVAGIWSDVYAGSAFSLSPSPSSLPLPSFFNKKQVSKIVDDSATRDLRRLLRLD
ncbi:hypothetical protein F0562_000189 [Nyssa sinensis]|uniref:Uncharacterized protein n=1 Tax=Nyssa sinensis TaxID=561372 RepID=A0A5J5C111_9ASTE|nr:hypothetical protein F0562_000189 [Nyssa sinensis]